MERTDGAPRIPGSRAGDEIGKGRILEDMTSAGSPDADDPGVRDDPGAVDDASADSFPASDPPGFGGGDATPSPEEPRAAGDVAHGPEGGP